MNIMNYTAAMARRDAKINKKSGDEKVDKIEKVLKFIKHSAEDGRYSCGYKLSDLTYHDYLILKHHLENLGYKVSPPNLEQNGEINDVFTFSWREEDEVSLKYHFKEEMKW